MAKVNRKELAGLLSQVRHGVAAKDSNLQETCVVFSDGYVYTYNDVLCVSASLPDSLAEDSSFTEFAIQAREFSEIVNKLKDEELNIELKNDCLLIKTKRSKAEMKIETEVKMPINEIHFPSKFFPLPEGFSVALKDVLPVVGRDMTKELNTCVYFHENIMEASDIDKAARRVFDKSINFRPTFLPRLPASSAVVKFDPDSYAITDGWMHFKRDDAILSCRTYYEGQQFVDLSEYLDQKGVVLDLPKDLPNALERAGVFIASSDGTEIIHEDKYVNIRIVDNWCIISGEGSIGRYTEKLQVEYDGEEIEFETDVQTLVNAVAENQTVEICSGHVKIFDDNFSYLVSFND